MKDKSYLIHSHFKGFPFAVLSVSDSGRVSHHGWTRRQNLAKGENVEDISVLADVPVRDLVFVNVRTWEIISYGADISFLTSLLLR